MSFKPSFPASITWWSAALLLLGFATAAGAGEEMRGLPFIRAYALDEIGKVPRSSRIGFDSFGRFAVMYDGIYTVLNDTAWVDRIDPDPANRTLMTLVRVVNGTYYYGGRASWGIAEPTKEGNLRARSLVPPDAPEWTTVTSFSEILPTRTGIYFYELNGVVYWDFASHRNHFFEMPRVSRCFRVGDRVFVSCEDRLLREILPATGSIRVALVAGLEGAIVERAAPLDETRTLLALQDGRLLTFDGTSAAPWPPQAQLGLTGRVLALTPLVEGGVGLSLAGKGLILLSADGTLRWRLPLTEFRLVGSLVTNEPGVLWAMGENAIYKVFYDSPLTSIGQSLGLTVSWPRIVRWHDRMMVFSGRSIYESADTEPGAPSQFQRMTGLPEARVSAMAAQGRHLLAADPAGIFAAREDGTFEPVAQLQNAAKIEFIGSDVCVVIGSREIAALRYTQGRWTECAPRIAGVGDAPVRTTVRRAVWIEMGGDNVAKLTFQDGLLHLERIALPWSGGQWTNIGAVGPIIILSGAQKNRAFYDEEKNAFCAAPALEALLNRSPYWITRVTEDETGTLWATHTRGVMTFTPENGDYRLDATTFELRNDSYPEVTVMPGNSIWVNSGRSLYHVERQAVGQYQRPRIMLVSLVADPGSREILGQTGKPAGELKFSYDDNSPSFRFFSGTYAWRSPPLYQYRLGASEAWTPVDASQVLHFPKLRDGAYRLEVRPAGPAAPETAPLTMAFVVNPPWYRSGWSYGLYAALLLLALALSARWLNQRSLRRNAELEELVHARTRELEVTMEKLNEETRNAATHAERSRVAGEIHDSLQQGLSGTMLHLETTMTHPSLSAEVQAQLDVIRKMLSYSREEVQHAVWNLESPLLQDSTLDTALHKLAGYFNAGTPVISVSTPPDPVALEPGIQHHLLRIAQEAITNAIKHAQAGRISVTLESRGETVDLRVVDDGRGFDPEAGANFDGHFGLRGLRGRAQSIDAQLLISSAPGRGTTVQVTVPRASPPS